MPKVIKLYAWSIVVSSLSTVSFSRFLVIHGQLESEFIKWKIPEV